MSEVERLLNEMFDRLAGTGAAGRRALAETEDHLRDAVAEGMARNLSAEQAEHDAVARFGSPARIAGQLRRAHRAAWLNRALSGAWLLAGLGLVVLGASYLIAATGSAALLPMSNGVSVMQGTAIAGLIMLLVGVIVLVGRRLAIRLGGLAPAAGRFFPLLAASLFALAGLALFVGTPFFDAPGLDWLPFAQQGSGLRVWLVASGVAVVTSIAAAAWGLALAHRPRDLR